MYAKTNKLTIQLFHHHHHNHHRHYHLVVLLTTIYLAALSCGEIVTQTNRTQNNNNNNNNIRRLYHYRQIEAHKEPFLSRSFVIIASASQTPPPNTLITTISPTSQKTITTTLTPVEIPDFEEPIGNHTVALGRDAQLSCKINNLGNFRTAWLRVEDKGILTIHNNIITRNYRVGLINNDDGKNFILTIRNVQPSDKGGYMCQINSVPMKYAIGYLDVLTPPAFDDAPPYLSSSSSSSSSSANGAQQLASDSKTAEMAASQVATTTLSPPPGASLVTVSEGKNASLTCRANGHPQPVITWRREDNEPILLNGANSLDGLAKIEAPTILLSSVSRLNSGAYLCIASNGVQPSASKRQVLDVQFRPVIRLPQTEVGASIGQQDVKLSCYVELNPLGTYHWAKLPPAQGGGSNGGGGLGVDQQQTSTANQLDDLSLIEHDELMNSDKFEIVIKQVANEKVQMSLILRQIDRHDFAWYKCIARNSLGIQSNSIKIYESSSFSLNSMFGRGNGGNGNGNPPPPDPFDPSLPEHHLNDQQEPQVDGRRPSTQTRAHTRSSWIQRHPSGGGRHNNNQQQDQQPTNALLDSISASSAASPQFTLRYHMRASSLFSSSTTSSLKDTIINLLLFHCNYENLSLLLLNCFLVASLTQRRFVVVVDT